jgi:hypothetical protein
MENTVDMFDIWVKVESGGTAIDFESGKNLKLVARIVNGKVLILEEGYALEKRKLSKEESERFINPTQ